MDAEKIILNLKGDREEAEQLSASQVNSDKSNTDCADCCDCGDCSCDCGVW